MAVLFGSCFWLFAPKCWEGDREGPMNGTLSFYECRLSGGDTQFLPAVIEFFLLSALTLSEVVGTQKHLPRASRTCSRPTSHLVKLSLPINI